MPFSCPYCQTEIGESFPTTCPACGQQLGQMTVRAASAGPRALLDLRQPGQPPQQRVLDQPSFSVGRSQGNGIILPFGYVSRQHGRLEQSAGGWIYQDLGSSNGTFVNGERVQQAVLRDGDVLRIGDPHGNSVSLTFRLAPVEGQPSPGEDIRIGATTLGMRNSLLLGRSPQADLPLSSPQVSRQHARLDRTAQGHVITDLRSLNGTFVNGRRIEGLTPLVEGDVIQIGPFRLKYGAERLEQRAAVGGMRLDGLRLTREVGSRDRRKRILDDISLTVYPREFVALVGASGAGKSTLLRALNGYDRADGWVLVNGDSLYRHADLYRAAIGYVPQDDIIHRELTVEKVLRYSAQLRLPPDTSREEIDQRIKEVLQQVEMVGQRSQTVSSLSGGQRKRVSIAVELLAAPSLFFLDEPTSGLDPGLEKKMMLTLRRLADSGHTIVLVTHATANIRQCDHVCFLAQGRMVFYGPPDEALTFFGIESGDFAEIYAQLDDADPEVARSKAAEWHQRFAQSTHYQQYVLGRWPAAPVTGPTEKSTTPPRPPRANPFRQFYVLSRRYLDLVLHDRLLLIILMAIMPVMALLVVAMAQPFWLVGQSQSEIASQLAEGMVNGERSSTYAIVASSQVTLNAMVTAAIMLGIFGAAYEIVKERSVFRRERKVALRLVPYVASKVVVLIGFALIQCLLFLITVSLKVRLPRSGVFLPAPVEMYVTLVFVAGAATMAGLFVSALVPRANSVIYVALVVLFFQFIFGGVQFKLAANRAWMSKLTTARWGNEALGASANVEFLSGLTQTRFLPGPITREVSIDIERPADDWSPVTVATTTTSLDVPCGPDLILSVPITVPEVTLNDMVTVTETITREFTVDPEAIDVAPEPSLPLDYSRTTEHLVQSWLRLALMGMLFGAGTVLVLRRQDG